MLKLRFVQIALAATLGCIAAPSSQGQIHDWVKVNGHDASPTRILARLKEDATAQVQSAPAQTAKLHSLGLTMHRQFQLVPGLVVLDAEQGSYVAASATPQERADALMSRIEELKKTGLYEYVEPDYVVTADVQPSDAAFQDGTLWGLRNIGNLGGVAGADISATNAWGITTGSSNVVVAVIDTGVRYTHQDLRTNMWHNPGETGGGKETNGIDDDLDGFVDDVYGINAITNSVSGDPFDDHGHGTHVSGTIGAQANGGGPHVGVAWNVQIMACKFLDSTGSGLISDAITCLNFAVSKGVKVSNNSWGGGGFSQGMFDALLAARGSNHLFIAAAGNNGLDNDTYPEYAYPSTYPLDNIISVAALDRADQLAYFSDYGLTNVDLGAPGVDIYSCVADSDSSYAYYDGTSQATPHVTGVAALLMAKYPSDSYLMLRDRLLNTVVTNSAMMGRSVTGGRLNAYNALTAAPDGIMELSVTPPEGDELLAGSTNTIAVRVSDLFPVTNATVNGNASMGPDLFFLNDGVRPDTGTNDGVYTAYLIAPTNVPYPSTNITITIVATAPGKTDATKPVTYLVVPPAPNDYFTNAIKITTRGEVVTGRNKFATREPGEPSTSGATSHTLWWKWSSAVSGPVLVDTSGSTFDTVMAIYTGNNVSALTWVASVDDAGGRLQGFLTFNAIAGKTYFIQVGAYGSNEYGDVRLRVEPNGVADTGYPTVQITSPASGAVLYTNATSNPILVTGVANDPPPGASGISEVQVFVNDARIATTANGTTNWSTFALLRLGANTIRAVAYDFVGQSSSTSISFTYAPPPPPNDNFDDAIALLGDSGIVTADTTQATKENGEPNKAYNEGGKSVWWDFTPPADGILFLSTTNSTFDTLIGVFTGSSFTNLTTVGGNDDAPDAPDGELYSELNQVVLAGEVYHIAVDGYGGLSGAVQMIYSFSPAAVFRVTVDTNNMLGGTVTPTSAYAASNTVAVFTAMPTNQYYGFTGWTWSGGFSSTNNPLNLVVQSDITLAATFALLPHSDGFESGDLTALDWTSGGGVPWIVQNTNVLTGSFAARSGVIGDSQDSLLVLITNFQAGSGSFDYMVSSEPVFDYFEFSVDGLPQLIQWGTEATNWNNFVFDLTSGTHVLEWRYHKDTDTSAGMDAAFIDNVDLPLRGPGVPIDETSPAHLSLRQLDDGKFMIDLTGQTNQTYVLEYSKDFMEPTKWSPISTNQAVDGQAHFPVSNSGGTRYYRAYVPPAP